MGYCDGNCEFLQRDKRHSCAKYGMNGTRLTYIKQTGSLSFESHEQCELCERDKWIKQLEEKIKESNEILKESLSCDDKSYRIAITDALSKLNFN